MVLGEPALRVRPALIPQTQEKAAIDGQFAIGGQCMHQGLRRDGMKARRADMAVECRFRQPAPEPGWYPVGSDVFTEVGEHPHFPQKSGVERHFAQSVPRIGGGGRRVAEV